MKKSTSSFATVLLCVAGLSVGGQLQAQIFETNTTPEMGASTAGAEIRTPPAPPTPRINGPDIFGVRPGDPFFYQIPATGDRPMTFSADHLPKGLKLDSETGLITGSVHKKWFGLKHNFVVTLHAKNAFGEASKKFKIVVGETIALTPPMGWNSWNCWGVSVDEAKVRAAAEAMVKSGLIHHGWTYINIDDTWQGERGGQFNGIQPNEKFPDMKKLCDEVHGMGLKIGIYSTPWTTSYAGHIGGSSDDTNGAWTRGGGRRDGKYSFADNDAKQWAAWGMDYLKYDWNPRSSRDTEQKFIDDVSTMAAALRHSGRDMVYSYSNSMPPDWIKDVAKYFNCWRTTGDINDSWWRLTDIGFAQSRWTQYSRPGHWNDPDMLVVGYVDVGKGRNLHPSRLTPDEQYTHITWWCLLAAPLLIGCDMDRLDPFTLGLLSNDEVLAVDQDSLGKQAVVVSEEGPEVTLVNHRNNRPDQTKTFKARQVWARPLEDGSHAVGLFNFGDTNMTVTVKWSDLKISGDHAVRDLWRQKDLGRFKGEFSMTVAPHGAELVKIK
jgi:alpha-galactosidase